MKNRYDLMTASSQRDTVGDDDTYPDVLSLDYTKLISKKEWRPFLKVTTDEDFKLKPYLKVWLYYNKLDNENQVEMDDIVLDLNHIKHLAGMLDEETIYFPDPVDFNSFYSDNLKTNG